MTKKSSTAELRRVTVARLRGDAEVRALLGAARVYEIKPKENSSVSFPYIIYSKNSTGPWDTDGDGEDSNGYGKEHTMSLQVYDDQEGSLRIDKILRRCFELLQDSRTLSLVDHRVVNIRFLLEDVSREPDGQTWQGTHLYKVITEET